MVAIVGTLVPPVLVGVLMAWLAWPNVGAMGRRGAFTAALGVGLGLGLGSWTYFLWAAFVGPARPGFLVAELLFFGLLVVLLLSAWRRTESGEVARLPSRGRWRWSIYTAFGVVVVFATAFVLFDLVRRPHGEIDAWQIWNLHARLLVRGDDHWSELLARLRQWSHPDYPLLVPATVARSWCLTGEENTLTPRVVAFLFGAATVGLLTAGVALLRTPVQGCLAGLVLLATPSFLRFTAAQYADVPLGFYILASVYLFEAHDALNPGTVRLPLLTGLTAGLAAWTKNEGQLFVLVSLLAQLWMLRANSAGPPRRRQDLIAFIAGLLPFAFALAYFKLRLAGPNDLVLGQQDGGLWLRLFSPWRTAIILGEMAAALARIGPGAVFVLALYGLLLGRAAGATGRGRYALTVLLLMTAGYALVYQLTPHDLQIHIALSVDRLCLHLWPAALMLFFLRVASPSAILVSDAS